MTQPPLQAGTDVRMTPEVETTSSQPGSGGAIPPRVSIWEDFLDIFYDPSAVFARREGGSVWIPTLVVTALIGTFFVVNSGIIDPIMEAEFRRTMAANARSGGSQLSAADLERGRQFAVTFGKFMGIVTIPILIVLMGLTLWLVGKLVGAKQSARAAIVVAAYAYMPKALEAVLSSVQGLLIDTSTLDGRFRMSFGIGRFLDPDITAPALLAFLGRVDVFTLWVTVLLAIGLSVTGKIPRSQAALAAALVWIVGALPSVLPALMQG